MAKRQPETLRDMLRKLGLGAPAAARLAKVSRSMLHYWLEGRYSPRNEKVPQLAKAWGVGVDRLLAALDASKATFG